MVKNNLAKKSNKFIIIAISCFIISIIFSSSNITGNAVSEYSTLNSTSLMSIIFFFMGLFALYFRKKV